MLNKNIKNTIRGEQDALQSIGQEPRLGLSLNAFFNNRIYNNSRGEHERENLDAYWTATGLTVPAGYQWFSIVSRKWYSFPTITVHTKLLDPALMVGAAVHAMFGFEAGGEHRICDIKLDERLGVVWFEVVLPTTSTRLDLVNLLTANYLTTDNRYTIVVNRPNAELYINDILRAVILLGLPEAIPSWENVPYAIGSVIGGWHKSFSTKLEISNAGTALTFPILMGPTIQSENRFMAAEGDPLPPRQYQLYTENTATEWSALAVGNGVTYNSHPVPIWGYERKWLAYKMTATLSAATLQAYVGGGWETVAALTVDGAIHYLEITNEAPIVRITVTGGAGDGIVNKAQVYMR